MEEIDVCMDKEVDATVIVVSLVCGGYSAPLGVFTDDVVLC